MPRWWVRRGENTFGPLEASTIVEALRDGRIEPGDLACKEGGREWLLVSAVPEVAEMFAPKRSQPPPEQDPWTEAAWMVGDLDGEIVAGPVSMQEVKEGIARGTIPGGALLARVGSSAWRPMQDVFEEEMKTGVRANPLFLAQQRAQAPQPHPPVQPRPSAPPLPIARPSSAPRPPSKPPGPPPPRRATQMIMQPPAQTAQTPAPPAYSQPPPRGIPDPRTLTEPPPRSPTLPPARAPTHPPQATTSAPPPVASPSVPPGSMQPPPMAPRPRPANRRTLLEGAQTPSSSEMTMNPGDGLEWWVSRDGNPVGPLTTEQVREALMHGAIDAQTAVCRADQQEWKPATMFNELTGAAPTQRTRPPPLPPRR